VVRLTPEEAELSKLFANAWRFVKFSTANEFHMIAAQHGLDYDRIRRATAVDYPRAGDLPAAGYVGGPCLEKDTVQLAHAAGRTAAIARAAIEVNRTLPERIRSLLSTYVDLSGSVIGLLGVTFKPDSDDRRSSLATLLAPLLEEAGSTVLLTDPLAKWPDILSLEEVVERADALVVTTPHSSYRSLGRTAKTVLKPRSSSDRILLIDGKTTETAYVAGGCGPEASGRAVGDG
jgi:UDP-N-acetyl-D-mannosaminuronic acid dehydrogenase